jgi:hypothetical protein
MANKGADPMFSNKIIRQCYRANGDPEPLYDGFTGYRIVGEMLNDGSTRIINVMRKSELLPMDLLVLASG